MTIKNKVARTLLAASFASFLGGLTPIVYHSLTMEDLPDHYQELKNESYALESDLNWERNFSVSPKDIIDPNSIIRKKYDSLDARLREVNTKLKRLDTTPEIVALREKNEENSYITEPIVSYGIILALASEAAFLLVGAAWFYMGVLRKRRLSDSESEQ